MSYDLLASWRFYILLHRDDRRQFTTTTTLIVCKETLVRRAFVLSYTLRAEPIFLAHTENRICGIRVLLHPRVWMKQPV